MISNIEFAPGIKGDIHLPDTPAPEKGYAAVLLIHGGAWSSMERSAVDGIAQMLSDNGFAVFNIDYRLAPRHRWPCGIEDCKAALNFLMARGSEFFPLDPGKIFVAGGSSGGHYALITALTAPKGSVAGIISLSGIDDVFTDFALSPGRYQTLLGYVPEKEDLEKIDPASFYYDGAPPILCTHFLRDTVVPADSCRAFAEKVRERGGNVSTCYYDFGRDGQGHAIWIPGTNPRRLYSDLEEEMLKFLRKHCC